MPIRVMLCADGSVYKISIIGQFDVSHSTHFEDVLQEIPQSVDVIRIDLKDMMSSDASFMSSVLLLREKYPAVIIELFNCSKSIARRFAMAGIDRLIRVRLAANDQLENKHDVQNDEADEGSV